MTDVFALGERRLDWIAARQETIARNVANADTPGYKPSDLRAFEARLDALSPRLAVTNRAHLVETGLSPGDPQARQTRGWETSISGNAVSIEQELARGAETNRAAGAANAALRAFHRMTIMAAKG